MGDHSIYVAANSGDESCKPCIFEVPTILYRHSPKSFTPNSFSIGPLHHTQEHLKATEKIKQHYLDNLISRKTTPQTTREESDKSIHVQVIAREFYASQIKNSILEVEGRARKCYAFPTDHLNKEEFVNMLVLDGCFIIELLRNNEIYTKKNDNNINTLVEDDPVFSVSWVHQVLYHDLILLENQIPWFVLVRLFDMTTSPTISGSTKSLTDLALDFFAIIFSAESLPKIEGHHESNHILDLLRNSLVSSFKTGQQSSGDWQQIPTATSLKELGITFKKSKSSKLLDIEFGKHGVLEIPSLLIQGTTCQAFRNLISYEQCYPNCEAKITSYVVLLNNLINTTKDINVLREANIVDNWLNPNDTVEFFKNIYTDTYVKEFYYSNICQDVNNYTKRCWPRARAAYVHNHFADPWGIASQIVTVIVLILTLLQTWYTMQQSWEKKDKSSPPSPFS